MPKSTFTHTVRVGASPASVWEALQRPGTWEGLGLMDTVTDGKVRDGRLIGFRWTALAAGRPHRGTARARAADGHRMSLLLDSAEMEGVIDVMLTPQDGATTMTVTLGARSKGLLASMFWGQVSQALDRGLEEQLNRFAERFADDR